LVVLVVSVVFFFSFCVVLVLVCFFCCVVFFFSVFFFFFFFFFLQTPLTEIHLQAGIKDNPEFAPVQVVLQGERPTRTNGDDLKASGGAVGIGPEFSPGPNLLADFFPELDARPIRRSGLHAR